MVTFETFALQCAAGIALDLLVAIASTESGIRPLAIRDGDKVIIANSPGEGVAVAVGMTDQGREPGIGLMGLTPRQLRAAGMSLPDGFDACKSLKAAALVIDMAQKAAASQGHGPSTAERIATRSWWRPDSRFPSAAILEATIARERTLSATLIKKGLGTSPPATLAASSPPPTVAPPRASGGTQTMPDCWDIFALQRAGLQQCDASDLVASASVSRSKPTAATNNAPAEPGR